MPTVRRRLPARQVGIPERAAAAWRAGDKHECLQALGLWPCDWAPHDVTDDGPPPDWTRDRSGGDAMNSASWYRAQELRRRLLAAAGPPGKYDRHGVALRADTTSALAASNALLTSPPPG